MIITLFLALAPWTDVVEPIATVATGETEDAALAEIVFETYDVAPATPLFHEGGVELSLWPYLTRTVEPEGWFYRAGDPEEIAGMLMELFADEFEYEGRTFEINDDDQLVVGAPRAVHERLVAILAFLEQSFAREARVRVDLLELPEGARVSAGRIPVAEAERLVAAATERRSHVLNIAPQRFVVVDESRAITRVIDYDVEIAERSYVLDPVIETFTIGTRLMATGALTSGGLQLGLILRQGRLSGPERIIDFHTPGIIQHEGGIREASSVQRVVDSPVLFRSLATSTFLTRGEAVVITSAVDVRTGSARGAVVLRLESDTGPSARTLELQGGGRLEVFDASGLGRARLSLPEGDAGPFTWLPWELEMPRHWSRESDLRAFLTAGDVEWAENSFFQSRDPDSLLRLGPWIVSWFRPSDEPSPGMTAAEIEAVTTEPELLEFEVELRSADGRTLAAWTLPLVAGEACAAALGGERTAVVDVDVEVAQGASITDPVVSFVLDGMLLWLHPRRGAGGRVTVDVKARVHLLRADIGPTFVSTTLPNDLDTFEADTLEVVERLSFPASGAERTAVLGRSGVSPTPGLSLRVRLR